MDGQIEVTRRFMIRLTEEELAELLKWWENLNVQSRENIDASEGLYRQLKAFKEGRAEVATVQLPANETATVYPTERDPSQFDRLRQQAHPLLGGEWIERS